MGHETDPFVDPESGGSKKSRCTSRSMKKVWIGVGVLVLLAGAGVIIWACIGSKDDDAKDNKGSKDDKDNKDPKRPNENDNKFGRTASAWLEKCKDYLSEINTLTPEMKDYGCGVYFQTDPKKSTENELLTKMKEDINNQKTEWESKCGTDQHFKPFCTKNFVPRFSGTDFSEAYIAELTAFHKLMGEGRGSIEKNGWDFYYPEVEWNTYCETNKLVYCKEIYNFNKEEFTTIQTHAKIVYNEATTASRLATAETSWFKICKVQTDPPLADDDPLCKTFWEAYKNDLALLFQDPNQKILDEDMVRRNLLEVPSTDNKVRSLKKLGGIFFNDTLKYEEKCVKNHNGNRVCLVRDDAILRKFYLSTFTPNVDAPKQTFPTINTEAAKKSLDTIEKEWKKARTDFAIECHAGFHGKVEGELFDIMTEGVQASTPRVYGSTIKKCEDFFDRFGRSTLENFWKESAGEATKGLASDLTFKSAADMKLFVDREDFIDEFLKKYLLATNTDATTDVRKDTFKKSVMDEGNVEFKRRIRYALYKAALDWSKACYGASSSKYNTTQWTSWCVSKFQNYIGSNDKEGRDTAIPLLKSEGLKNPMIWDFQLTELSPEVNLDL